MICRSVSFCVSVHHSVQPLFDHITELQNMNSEEEDEELGGLAFTCDIDSLLNHSVNYC